MRVPGLLSVCAVLLLACGEESSPGVTVHFVAEGTTFNPASRTIVGNETTMIWGFRDGPHNVTFEDGATPSGNMSSGTFSRNYLGVAPGTHRFRCTLHSPAGNFTTGMVGSVIVP